MVETLDCARKRGGQSLLLVRHLMFHLTIQENLKVLQRIERLSHGVAGIKYVMMSTYLRANENEEDFLLASGHKINLFEWPYCVKDVVHLNKDGDSDLGLGLWDIGKGGLRKGRDNLGKRCL